MHRGWESAAPAGLVAVEVAFASGWAAAAAAVATAWAEGVSFAFEPEEVAEGFGAVHAEPASLRVLWEAVTWDRARGLGPVAPG